jgi:cell division protein FtsB
VFSKQFETFRTKYWTPKWLLLLVLPVTWVLIFDDGLLEQLDLRSETTMLEDSAQVLQRRIMHQRAQNSKLEGEDPFAIEEEARRAGMVRPGDEVYHLVLGVDSLKRGW